MRLDLEESWEKSFAQAKKEELEQMVKKITPPKPGEINFMGIKTSLKKMVPYTQPF